MDKIFGILTAVVIVLSVWIGFKNSSKLADQKDSLQSEEARLESNQTERKEVKAKLDAAETAKEDAIAQNKAAKEELATVQTTIKDLKSQVAEKEAALKEVEVSLAATNELVDQVNDSQDLIDQVKSTEQKIAQLKADVATEKTNLEGAQQSMENAEAMLAAKKVIIESWSTGNSAPTLSTSVKGVYSTWGFVTLNSGNAQGVVPGSILDVLRNGEVVAKLKVTTVEQNRSAADIIRDDSGIAVALRSGDRVVAEKTAQ